MAQADSFLVVRFGSRPLLAIPAGSARWHRAVVGCYPGRTWKRRQVRFLIAVALATGLGGLVWRRTSAPVKEVGATFLHSWLEGIRARLADPTLQAVIVWPAQANRGRVYVHLLDKTGHDVAFAKIGLDEKNNRLISNERDMLERLWSMKLRQSRVPGILEWGHHQGFAFLVVESLPSGARTSDWEDDPPVEDNIKEYCGESRLLAPQELGGLRWWGEFWENSASIPAFANTVRRAAQSGVEVSRIHGDLNRTNVLRVSGEVWLLDWEQGSEAGPCLTDLICVEVDRRWALTQRDPSASLQDFCKANWQNRDEEHRRRVTMGLAYLHAAGFTPATGLLRRWEELS